MQGAGIAAALIAIQQQQQQQQQQRQEQGGPQTQLEQPPFRFAILASGYPPTAPHLVQLLSMHPVTLPSLHLTGALDRQVKGSDNGMRRLKGVVLGIFMGNVEPLLPLPHPAPC